MTANSTEHLPDWPAQNVGKMLTAFCGCFWFTDQFFDLTGKTGTGVYIPLPPLVIESLEGIGNTGYFFWSGEGKV
jgi:hypothetical protein